MKKSVLLTAVCAACLALEARTMKVCVVQPMYAKDPAKVGESVAYQMEALRRCDESLDIVVLPEAADRQGKILGGHAGVVEAYGKYNAPLLKLCAETARRCRAIVFVNALKKTPTGLRNTTFAYDRTGTRVDTYDKEHLVRSEHTVSGLDGSYMWEWTRPKIMVIDGVRFAFMTCYDFYFYENYANIARMKPDVIIGCSHQRSDRHDALEMFGRFLAYNTCAYVVRASVSMGLDSPLGGSSMIVSPMGEILGNLRSRVGTLTVEFDPHAKYLKPAGYGNPPATHPSYIEIGRRPWKYRPAGSAIVPAFSDAKGPRVCAHRGFSSAAPENSLPAFGAAVALGAAEIEFDLWWTKDGEIVSLHDATLERVSDGKGKVYEKTYDELKKLDFGYLHGKPARAWKGLRILRFEEILRKFSCHTIMNIHLKSLQDRPWNDAHVKKVVDLIDAFDARGHVYFMTENDVLQAQLARLAPGIPRCMGHDHRRPGEIVERAIASGCQMVQFFRPHVDRAAVERAHAAGLRCNLFSANDPSEAERYFAMGIDTVLADDYLTVSSATGVR